MPSNLITGAASTDFGFTHLEADTILLSAYANVRTQNYNESVVLDSENTDVYVQAAYASHQIQGNVLIKRKNEFISCSTMLSKDAANVIIPLHHSCTHWQ